MRAFETRFSSATEEVLRYCMLPGILPASLIGIIVVYIDLTNFVSDAVSFRAASSDRNIRHSISSYTLPTFIQEHVLRRYFRNGLDH